MRDRRRVQFELPNRRPCTASRRGVRGLIRCPLPSRGLRQALRDSGFHGLSAHVLKIRVYHVEQRTQLLWAVLHRRQFNALVEEGVDNDVGKGARIVGRGRPKGPPGSGTGPSSHDKDCLGFAPFRHDRYSVLSIKLHWLPHQTKTNYPRKAMVGSGSAITLWSSTETPLSFPRGIPKAG
jgi:hypothetical protein